MTKDEESFKLNLDLNRNKLKMLISYHLDRLTDALLLGQEPVLPIPSKSGSLMYSKNPERFEIYLETIVEIYYNLVKKQTRTKRDIFYGNSQLYKRQSVLDATVANLSKTFSVPRDALNVIGAAKGLYFGDIVINHNQYTTKQLNLIPRREDITMVDLLETKFILIIEKDAVMNVIAEQFDEIKKILGSFLLISGKGFPCMRTKQFMNLLETQFTDIPKYILVDNDPYGIDIALNYATKTENENDSCESIQYIGVDHFDLDQYGNQQMFEPLNPSDLRRLESVKKKAKALNRFRELDEIKFMQNNLKKAEIESLYSPDCETFCLNFLVKKLQGLSPRMEEEDIALKKRLLVDERILRKLSKKLLTSNQKVPEMDKEQFGFQLDKNMVILNSFERDWNHITQICQQIEEDISEENDSISGCKSDLIEAKQILQNRLDYDKIAKEILTFQSQTELQKNINDVSKEIEGLVSKIETIDQRTQDRYSECSNVLESVQILLESVNSDIKEFK